LKNKDFNGITAQAALSHAARLLYRANSPARRQTKAARIERDSVSADDIRSYKPMWLVHCDNERPGTTTNALRSIVIDNLVWYLDHVGKAECGRNEIVGFFHYMNHGHAEPGGRWGNPSLTKAPARATLKTYDSHLRVFFKWLIAEEVVDVNPLDRLPMPKVPKKKVQPLSSEDRNALLRAASHSTYYPKRDVAILQLFLDTGVRVSELCNLKRAEIDIAKHRATVTGKGMKERRVYFGAKTARVLQTYLLDTKDDCAPTDPLFLSDRGRKSGQALTRSGVQQMFTRWNHEARLTQVRVSPHTCRHTYAIEALRAGMTVLQLQEALGHEKIEMVQKYVKLAEADLERAAKQYSPMDRHNYK